MNDPLDKTAFSDGLMPTPEPRHLALPVKDEDLERLAVQKTSVPGVMLAAGILWILSGAAYVTLFGIGRLLEVPLQSSDFWLILGAFFFIKDGIQLIRGKFRDPKGDGVFSVGVGLFFLVHSYMQFEQAGTFWVIAFGAFFGTIFLIPGILVLVGRKEYLAWKAEQESDSSRQSAV